MNAREPRRSEIEITGEVFEIEPGRTRTPYTDLSDWVRLSGVSTEAVALYWTLKMHVNVKRGDNLVWPTANSLAVMMGVSRGDRITRYLRELEGIGAITTKRRGMPARNVYLVHDEPPPGYAGPRTLAEWYAIQRAVAEAVDSEKPQVTPVPRKSGEQGSRHAVDRKSGEQEPRKSGDHVDRKTGHKQAVKKQDRKEQPSPPPPAGSSPAVASGVGWEEVEDSITTDDPGAGVAEDVLDAVVSRHLSDPRRAPRGKHRATLVGLIGQAMAAGWNPLDVGVTIGGSLDDADSVFGVLRHRLADLGPPPAASGGAGAKRGRPVWCGVCVESTRMVEDVEDRPSRCPRCHPLAVSPAVKD